MEKENIKKKSGLKERYYFTFYVDLDRPYSNCYHVIEAEDAESARDQMFETFGLDWAFQYTHEQWLVSKEKYDLMQNSRTVGEWHEGYTQAELYNLKRI